MEIIKIQILFQQIIYNYIQKIEIPQLILLTLIKILRFPTGVIQLLIVILKLKIMEQDQKENSKDQIEIFKVQQKVLQKDYTLKYHTMLGVQDMVMKQVIFQLLMLGDLKKIKQCTQIFNIDSQFQGDGNLIFIQITILIPADIFINQIIINMFQNKYLVILFLNQLQKITMLKSIYLKVLMILMQYYPLMLTVNLNLLHLLIQILSEDLVLNLIKKWFQPSIINFFIQIISQTKQKLLENLQYCFQLSQVSLFFQYQQIVQIIKKDGKKNQIEYFKLKDFYQIIKKFIIYNILTQNKYHSLFKFYYYYFSLSYKSSAGSTQFIFLLAPPYSEAFASFPVLCFKVSQAIFLQISLNSQKFTNQSSASLCIQKTSFKSSQNYSSLKSSPIASTIQFLISSTSKFPLPSESNFLNVYSHLNQNNVLVPSTIASNSSFDYTLLLIILIQLIFYLNQQFKNYLQLIWVQQYLINNQLLYLQHLTIMVLQKFQQHLATLIQQMYP